MAIKRIKQIKMLGSFNKTRFLHLRALVFKTISHKTINNRFYQTQGFKNCYKHQFQTFKRAFRKAFISVFSFCTQM